MANPWAAANALTNSTPRRPPCGSTLRASNCTRLETLSEDGEEVKLHLRRAARFEVQHRAICQALGIDLQPGASKNSSTEPPKPKNCYSGVPHGDCCESRLWIRN